MLRKQGIGRVMTFGLKKIFDEDHDDEDMKEIRKQVKLIRKDIDPISLHQGPGHRIEKGPAILGCEEYLMCKTCCKEVVATSIFGDDDDNGAVMF
jgi:hypothetical protein